MPFVKQSTLDALERRALLAEAALGELRTARDAWKRAHDIVYHQHAALVERLTSVVSPALDPSWQPLTVDQADRKRAIELRDQA